MPYEYLGHECHENERGHHCPALGLHRYATEEALAKAMRHKLAQQQASRYLRSYELREGL